MTNMISYQGLVRTFLNLSTSIGVAHSNECPTVERLKMLADERLYKSKKNGRAQISWQ
ncbi:putative lipoprotein [Escherichia coli H736]|nr:putative lipoprotein [Escherichia coli H736]